MSTDTPTTPAEGLPDHADPISDAPCARLTVAGDGSATATLYAPGLPEGMHDVWCVPVRPADFEAMAAREAGLLARIGELERQAAKSERRAVEFGRVIAQQCLAMQAALVETHLHGATDGMRWIINTLAGPGLLPDLTEARELGGAQAWFDRETTQEAARYEAVLQRIGAAPQPGAQPAGVPQGWRLVPDTPTQEMCQAGQEKASEWPRFPLRISPIYRAMLTAAPQPAPEAGPVLTDERLDRLAASEARTMCPPGVYHLTLQQLRRVVEGAAGVPAAQAGQEDAS